MARRILDWLHLSQVGPPASAVAGEVLLYARFDGNVYAKDSVVGERLLTHAIEAYTFSVQGTLAVQTGKSRIYTEGNYWVESVRASVDTAPTGATILVDVNKNGTTIYTSQGARPTIVAGTNSALGNTPAVTTFAAGDYLTVDVDQIGSTVAGADLTVTIRLRRTA